MKFRRSKYVVNTWLKEVTIEEMMDDETKEAVRFITGNPDQEKYISENLEHFMTGDEPDDNSIKLYDEWCGEYTKVVDWLKAKLAEPTPNGKGECEHPFHSVTTRCFGIINHCLKCGKDLF